MKNVVDYLKTCPICSNSNLKTVYRFEEFHILKCRNCENAWRSNMYDKKRIEEIYCVDNYEENPYFSYDLDSVLNMDNPRFRNFKRALDILKDIGVEGKLLDIGCGTGTFLVIAKQYGWDLSGIEISEDLSKICQKNVPEAHLINQRFEDYNNGNEEYSLITMWDVIEHVIDPIAVVSRIKSMLVDGGIALFCTPDESSLLARLGKALYHAKVSNPALALHPVNHTYFFSRKGFKFMIESLNMKVVKAYSQPAFFEHSEMASTIEKIGISVIEKLGEMADSNYEMVIMAK